MNRKYLKRICGLALLCIIGFALLSAAPDPEAAAVKDMLEKRADVMSNVLLDKLSYEEGKKLLQEVETDKLYQDDLMRLEQYGDAAIDMTTDMKVTSIKKTGQLYDRMTFESEIFWRYTGEKGTFGHKETYHIGVVKKGEDYRLISFELL